MVRRAEQHSRLAYAFIFLLAMRDVSAARESFQAQQLAAHIGSSLKATEAYSNRRSAVAASEEFSVRTMWSMGEEDSLRWAEANITFRFAGGHRRRYVEIAAGQEFYRVMPDAVVMNQEIEGMAVVAIMGWQAYDLSSGTWGESEYRKKYSLFFRTEMNPSIGVTKSGWWRVEGLRVYEAKQAQDKDDKEPKLYYINESGKMKSIDSDDVTRHAKHREELRLHIPGYADGVFKRPDRELMAMVDGMLGETSCMGNPSKCAFRCFYDSEHDVCGPVAFCQKAGTGAPDILAPFGEQQKCRAVGAESHEQADRVIAETGMGKLKDMAVDVTERLEKSEAVSWSSSGRSSLKDSVNLWLEAADVLNVLETLPMRVAEDNGAFPAAARRAAETDLKHWRRRPDKLSIQEYQAAAAAPVSSVKASRRFSVAAKLHSELQAFLVKRPSVLMHYVKSESQEKCILSDKTESDRNEVSIFVKYFLKVPGYNSDDLASVRLGLPDHCQEFLAGMDKLDVEHLSQDVATGEKMLEPDSPSFGELKSKRLSSLGSHDSFIESDTFKAAGEGTDEAQQKFVIIASIIVGLVCLVVAGTFFIAGLASINQCMKQNGAPGGEHCLAAFVCGVCGGLVICGAFAMSLIVGVAVLAGTMFLLNIARHYFLQTAQHEFHKSPLMPLGATPR
ncbi:unnamed protein product [Symbiodinium pilosum]|uniref:Uncharacterized protein n=1 Tax=Symbiodinium pilosum TaxID=2952 RepID=A0A812YAQ9_SYMPI|nr:unnamed protein product [Symbiodinium pilosum]